MWGINPSSRAKLLGNGGAVAGFLIMVTLEFALPGYRAWTQDMDAELFASSRMRPTGTICAVGAALVVGGIGYAVGLALDRRG